MLMNEFFIKNILSEELFGSKICESAEDYEIVNFLYEELMLEKLLYGEPVSIPELRKLLRNKILNFEFIKLDGEVRPARGTTMMKYIPKSDHPKGIRPSSPKVATFYDLDKDAWRSVSKKSKEVVLKKDEEKGKPVLIVKDKEAEEPTKKEPEVTTKEPEVTTTSKLPDVDVDIDTGVEKEEPGYELPDVDVETPETPETPEEKGFKVPDVDIEKEEKPEVKPEKKEKEFKLPDVSIPKLKKKEQIIKPKVVPEAPSETTILLPKEQKPEGEAEPKAKPKIVSETPPEIGYEENSPDEEEIE